MEICCGSADDVIQAKLAGADRVELNSSLFLGGLTPSVGEVKVAKKTGMEIIAMVRPREGGFCYTDAEFETMLEDVDALLDAGADGIVFGCLLPNGEVDKTRCEIMAARIGNHTKVFHRAIDVVPDWKTALDILCEIGIDRVLTSGQAPSVHYGMDVVREMIEYSGDRIEILPGAGIKKINVQEIVQKTGCTQVHLAIQKSCTDTSTSHNNDIFFGGALYPPEDRFAMADSGRIKDFIQTANIR